jgi:hypothetical protein
LTACALIALLTAPACARTEIAGAEAEGKATIVFQTFPAPASWPTNGNQASAETQWGLLFTTDDLMRQ